MEKQLEHRIGETAPHSGDFCIWTAIHNLDSPTNYREYLSSKTTANQPSSAHVG
jgi:hypothetical protein